MKRSVTILIVILLTSIITLTQEDFCNALLEVVLTEAEPSCEQVGRNEICYGHYSIVAEPMPDALDFVFQDAGDIEDVAAISEVRMSAIDIDYGYWGVAILKLQANIPDSLPGQNVTMLIFGDTQIRNQATSLDAQQRALQSTVNASINAGAVNVRSAPSLESDVLFTAAYNTTFEVANISNDGYWVEVWLPDTEAQTTGWIFGQLIRADDGSDIINAVENQETVYGPMQAFYFTTGIGNPECREATDGIMVQAPESVGTIEMVINEVSIEFASTIFFTQDDVRMIVAPIEGSVRASALGKASTAIQGSEIEIPINSNGSPALPPSDPKSYTNRTEIQFLPNQLLERQVTSALPLTPEQIEKLVRYQVLLNNIPLDVAITMYNFLLQTDDIVEIFSFLTEELNFTDFNQELSDYFIQNEIAPNRVFQDRDGDGVQNNVDFCPAAFGPVFNSGCPVDTDGDGIPDTRDQCPSSSGSTENGGCPADTDGDGVPDTSDQCPTEVGPAENSGCPVPVGSG